MKYLRSPPLKCKDIGIRKSEFVTKTQFLWEFTKILQKFLENPYVRKQMMTIYIGCNGIGYGFFCGIDITMPRHSVSGGLNERIKELWNGIHPSIHSFILSIIFYPFYPLQREVSVAFLFFSFPFPLYLWSRVLL